MFREIELPQLPYRPPIDLDAEHPFTVYDLVRCLRLSDPVVSPDGTKVVVVVEHWNEDDDKLSRTLWLVPLTGGEAIPLTAGHGIRDESPTWSPDSRFVAFVSDRSGSRQIWLADTAALDGRLRRLTELPVEVSAIRWSPDGRHIAFSARVYPGLDLEESARRAERVARSPARVRFYDRLPVRHWDRWLDGRYAHLFVLPVSEASDGWHAVGPPVDLMPDIAADCPRAPFGTRADYDWAPDGSELAYCVHEGDDRAWTTNVNVYTVSVEGSERRCWTRDNPAIDCHPRYSPDGRFLAILSTVRPGFESDRRRVRLIERSSGRITTLTESWDRSPTSFCWGRQSDTLYLVADSEARRRLYRLPIDGTARVEPEPLISDGYCDAPQAAANDTVVCLHDTMVRPAELIAIEPGGNSRPRRLTRFNDRLLEPVRFGRYEDFWFEGAGGDRVHAWVVEPPGRKPGQRVPVAVVIHGGPQGVVSDHFHYRWHLHVYAGAGYAVLAINFHGSAGFGQRFVDSVSRDWGGKPYEDIIAGLAAALRHYDWMDGERVAALGASYGGWMVNWINGHTDRFRCLVNHAGPFDEFYGYFSTDELWFPEWEHGGVPWEQPELFERFSPSRYVSSWSTPTLVLHGGRDYRVPETDGLATFTALQRRGVPSVLVHFPDEHHWILKRLNLIVWHEVVLSWLDHHCKPANPAPESQAHA